jgi:two-component system, chemotaxis family, sensor kinase CheA
MIEVVLERFLEEAHDLLEQGSKGLLQLERSPDDPALVNTVFRAFHTMKGSSALFDFKPMTRALHAGEDLLQEVREGSAELTSSKVDLLLAVLDAVTGWLDVLEEGGGIPDDAESTADQLITRARKLGGDRIAAEVVLDNHHEPVMTTTPDWLRFSGNVPEFVGQSLVGIEYTPHGQCFFGGDDPLRLMSLIPGLLYLRVLDDQPVPDENQGDPFYCRLRFRAVAGCGLDEVRNLLAYVQDQVKLYEFSVGFGAEVDLALRVLREVAQSLDEPALEAVRAARRQAHVGMVGRVLAGSGFPRSWFTEFERSVERAEASDDDLAVKAAVERIVDNVASAGRCGMRLSMLPQAVGKLSKPEGRLSLRAAPLPSLPTIPDDDGPGVVVQAAQSSQRKASAAKGSAARDSTVSAQVYKVDQSRIDSLLDLAGELLVAKNALPYLSRRAESAFAAPQLAREIKDQAAVLTRIADSFHHAVMQLRIIPLSHVFDRFPRLVRDLSKQLEKQVRLEIVGEATEADKSTVEKLADPLIHIVRNSLDHGLEGPDERVAAGKVAEGRISLTARQERGALIVTISDDGRGIDPERVRATALRRGVITQEEAQRMTDKEVINLIFRAGFSTKDTVTDLSGRGVGMDVVRSAIDACKGTVDVRSRVGQGTEVELTLPLSMAVTRVLLVETAKRTFGVPFDLVLETLHVEAHSLADIRGQQAVTIRERVVPVLWLSDILELSDAAAARSHQPERLTLLLARVSAGEVGIVVDAFHEAVDVMLKPLDGPLAAVRGYLGSSLLGDGRALLVLNLNELV